MGNLTTLLAQELQAQEQQVIAATKLLDEGQQYRLSRVTEKKLLVD